MQDSALPPLTASRWKESYCQLSTLLRAWASCEEGNRRARTAQKRLLQCVQHSSRPRRSPEKDHRIYQRL